MKLLQRTGSVVRNPDKYDQLVPRLAIPPEIQEKLQEYLNENPTTYLAEIQEWLLKEHDIVK